MTLAATGLAACEHDIEAVGTWSSTTKTIEDNRDCDHRPFSFGARAKSIPSFKRPTLIPLPRPRRRTRLHVRHERWRAVVPPGARALDSDRPGASGGSPPLGHGS